MVDNGKDYIRKNVDTIILRTLSESDSYGYDILKEIESKSDGVYVIKQPTLYNTLKRLEKIGYISSYEGDISQGGKRRYYTLTDLGRKVLEQETAEWEFSRTLMGRLLSDKEYDLSSPPPFNPNDLRPMTKRNVTKEDVMENLGINDKKNTVQNTIQKNEGNIAQNSLKSEGSNFLNNLPNNTNLAVNLPQKEEIPRPVTDEKPIIVRKELEYIDSREQFRFYNDIKVNRTEKDYKSTKGYQFLYGNMSTEEKKQEAPKADTAEGAKTEVIIQSTDKQISDAVLPYQIAINESMVSKEYQPKEENIPVKSYNISFNNQIDEKTQQLACQKLGLSADNSPAPSLSNANQGIIRQNADATPVQKIYNAEPVKTVYDERQTEDIRLSAPPARKERRVVEPVEIKPLSEKEIFTNDLQYRPALDDLFSNSNISRREDEIGETDKSYEFTGISSSFGSLKTKFKTEGIKLRPYSKTNTANFYLSSFIYNNQINRDCVTTMYFLIVAEILAIYFFANHLINLHFNTYLTIVTGLILIPIAFWIIYAVNPNKRIKAKFNFKVSILISTMVFLNLLVVIMLMGFFLFKVDITDFNSMLVPVIVPSILIINIPISSVVYSLLYNSKQYHLR